MLKPTLSVKELEEHAIGVLRELLDEIPGITVELLERETLMDREVDIIASVELAGQQYTLVCEVKKSGQPRFVRDAIHQLGDFAQCIAKPVTPVLIAPYLSNESRELSLQNKVSFLDFEGNARLTFGTVFIDRIRANKPAPERREFRSLFKPKSAQVLRVLLRRPEQSWKLVDLAEAASVSLGHASNVRKSLLDREWAELGREGLRLKAPGALLDAWKSVYVAPVAEEFRFYTTFHGSVLESHVRVLFESVPNSIQVTLASFSAAHWIAPYARTGSLFLWSEKRGLEYIREKLQLSSPAKGENVVVSVPKDNGVFFDAYEAERGIRCTSALQTYLDLSKTGERGEEAAEQLRRVRLTWQN
jgi:Transcriptional regulator, AbiEi antitoxin, Type IV TA system